MRIWKGSMQSRRWLAILSLAVPATLLGIAEAAAGMSEIDSYQLAVTSQNKESALTFIDEFSSSPLIGAMMESLRPEVAREVCVSLPSGPARLRTACQRLGAVSGTLPVAGQRAQSARSSVSDIGSGFEDVSANSSITDAEITDVDIAPAAGPQSSRGDLANTASRQPGTTGEASARAVAAIPPRLEDGTEVSATDEDGEGSLGAGASSKQSDPTPEPNNQRDRPTQPALHPGADPGSDPGGATSPTSHGKDPGSDSGSDSSGDSGQRDSHD